MKERWENNRGVSVSIFLHIVYTDRDRSTRTSYFCNVAQGTLFYRKHGNENVKKALTLN